MLLFLIYTVILNVILTAASEDVQSLHIHGRDDNHRETQKIFSNIKPSVPMNMTYIDKTENMLRMPTMTKIYEEHKTKKKTSKKSPKRTIQKIIRRNRSKKKFYMNQATSTTKLPTNGEELDNFYAQEEMSQKNENFTTIQVNQKKKHKWTRISRYPMPFQKLQPMREHKRNRRSEERQDLYIFTDLDEMEFLNNDNEKDKDVVVNAHVKKYW